VIDKSQPFHEYRAEAYRGDRRMAIMLTTVCLALLAITALGIVGLASFWVTQRRKQIGTRRALGATRGAIVRYFQLENALITAGGAVLGVALAVGLNVWMVSTFQLTAVESLVPADRRGDRVRARAARRVHAGAPRRHRAPGRGDEVSLKRNDGWLVLSS
jgi:hypothetical protein